MTTPQKRFRAEIMNGFNRAAICAEGVQAAIHWPNVMEKIVKMTTISHEKNVESEFVVNPTVQYKAQKNTVVVNKIYGSSIRMIESANGIQS